MITALIMAGGKARRLGGLVKPLLKVCGKTLLERVIETAYHVTPHVVVAVSPAEPQVVAEAHRLLADVLLTPGKGYAADLAIALKVVRSRPLLVLPVDTPFLEEHVLKEILRRASTAFGAKVVTVKACGDYVGVSLFISWDGGSPWRVLEFEECKYFMDIDTFNDLSEALVKCR